MTGAQVLLISVILCLDAGLLRALGVSWLRSFGIALVIEAIAVALAMSPISTSI